MGNMSLFNVRRVRLEAERLFPKSDDPTVVLRIEAIDRKSQSFQVTLFCEDGVPNIDFGYQHKIDLPIKRTDGITAAARIIPAERLDAEWQPMNITLDEAEHEEADRGIIPFEDVLLWDDGSLDTVIGIWCQHHATHHEHRWCSDVAEAHRNEDGDLNLRAFWQEQIKDDDSLLCEGEEES